VLGLWNFMFGRFVFERFNFDVFVEIVIDEAKVGFDYVVFVAVLFLA